VRYLEINFYGAYGRLHESNQSVRLEAAGFMTMIGAVTDVISATKRPVYG
jgi:hypothetical protein